MPFDHNRAVAEEVLRVVPENRVGLSSAWRRGMESGDRPSGHLSIARSVAALLAALAVGAGACEQPHDARLRELEKKYAADIGYERGRWRMAGSEADDTVLAAAHVLIAYKGTEFRFREQYVVGTSTRTRGEALKLAARVAAMAHLDPGSFPRLARENSDDQVTARQGGRIGVAHADQFLAEIVDALAVLEVGETSKVVETNFGFHVVQRLAVPDEQKVAGTHILIKHRLSASRVRPGHSMDRTRDEARALAEQVRSRAVQEPARFEQLAHQYSDDPDGLRRGDFGTWSNLEHAPSPALIDAASRLAVGEVSPIVDTVNGFEIVRRAPARNRALLRASLIVIAHVELPIAKYMKHTDRTPSEAKELAVQLVSRALSRPEEFATLQQQYCDVPSCDSAFDAWRAGRGTAEVEAVVETLAPGQIAPAPVESELGFYIIRRDEARGDDSPDQAARRVRFDLPAPPQRSLEDYVATLDGAALAESTEQLGARIIEDMKLSGEEAEKVKAIWHKLSAGFGREQRAEARFELLQGSRHELAAALGPERFARMRRVVAEHINELDRPADN
jgi:parvulin-like peptidyl-prolyl isomerase